MTASRIGRVVATVAYVVDRLCETWIWVKSGFTAESD